MKKYRKITAGILPCFLNVISVLSLTCCGTMTYYVEEHNMMHNVKEGKSKGILLKKESTDEKILKIAIRETERYGNCFCILWSRYVENKKKYLYSQNSYMWSYSKQADSNYIIWKYYFNGEIADSRKHKYGNTSWIDSYSSPMEAKMNFYVYDAPHFEYEDLYFLQKIDGKVVSHHLNNFIGPILTPGLWEFMDRLTRDVVEFELIPRYEIGLPDSIIQKYRIEQCL